MIPHSPYPEVLRPSPRRNEELEAYGRLEHGGDGAWVAVEARRRQRRLALLRAASVLAALFRRR